MSTTRLSFLYPHLFRSLRLGEPNLAQAAAATSSGRHHRPRNSATRNPTTATTTTTTTMTTRRRQTTFARRHGKAVEPTTPSPAKDGGEGKAATATATTMTTTSEGRAEKSPREKEAAAAAAAAAALLGNEATASGSSAASATEAPSASITDTPTTASGTGSGAGAGAGGAGVGAGAGPVPKDYQATKSGSGPLEAILQMPAPEAVARQHPHLTPPPYVHHFDSYSLVKTLEGGGYTPEQAVTAMKAIRLLLAQNLDVAQESLVSKSDVENEAYLFRAACSELSTEVKNSQRVEDEHMRQQRTLLQHEVDILQQSLNQELLTLNDNLKGMFNDRKMAVREEQKAIDSAIQQISYKISIDLSSDAKSEIEALRWVLIRRSVIGIMLLAILTLGSIRYATYVSHERQREAERKAREEEALRRSDGKRDHSSAPDAAEILTAC